MAAIFARTASKLAPRDMTRKDSFCSLFVLVGSLGESRRGRGSRLSAGRDRNTFSYGLLPASLYRRLRDQVLELLRSGKAQTTFRRP
jgi:hypothetical protein